MSCLQADERFAGSGDARDDAQGTRAMIDNVSEAGFDPVDGFRNLCGLGLADSRQGTALEEQSGGVDEREAVRREP